MTLIRAPACGGSSPKVKFSPVRSSNDILPPTGVSGSLPILSSRGNRRLHIWLGISKRQVRWETQEIISRSFLKSPDQALALCYSIFLSFMQSQTKGLRKEPGQSVYARSRSNDLQAARRFDP